MKKENKTAHAWRYYSASLRMAPAVDLLDSPLWLQSDSACEHTFPFLEYCHIALAFAVVVLTRLGIGAPIFLAGAMNEESRDGFKSTVLIIAMVEGQ